MKSSVAPAEPGKSSVCRALSTAVNGPKLDGAFGKICILKKEETGEIFKKPKKNERSLLMCSITEQQGVFSNDLDEMLVGCRL